MKRLSTIALLSIFGLSLMCCGGGNSISNDDNNNNNNKPEPATNVEATHYYKRILVMDFTATWCVYCPLMMKALETAADNYSDRVLVIANHYSSSDLYIGDAGLWALFTRFNISGFPTALYDYRDVLNSYSATLVTSDLQSEVKYNPSTVGIGIESKVTTDNKIDVKVKIKSGETASYKMVACVVEDGVVHRQVENGAYTENYVHNNLPLAFTPNGEGKDLGSIEKDKEISDEIIFDKASLEKIHKLYTSKDFDLTKCRVIVYVTKKSSSLFYIDNAVSCKVIDGKTDYKQE